MDGDKAVSATFAITQYTITASAGDHGSITPSGAVIVDSGSNVTFTMAPDAGYDIDELTVDGDPVAAGLSYPYIDVQADHTIYATYKLKDTLVSSAIPAGTYGNVAIDGCGIVSLDGDVVILGTMTVLTCQGLDTNGHVLSGSGAFTVDDGGSLYIGDPDGITAAGPTGSIRTSSRSYSAGATYVYNGSTNQVVGDGLPSPVANLTIANSGADGR